MSGQEWKRYAATRCRSPATEPPRALGALRPPTPAAGRVCVLLLLVSAAACGRDGYVNPRPPKHVGGASRAASQPPPLSTINVPMTIPVESLVDLLDRAIPSRYGDLEDFHPTADSGRVQVAFELERAPLRASFFDDIARLSTTVLYRVRVHYDLPLLPDVVSSCGIGDDPRPALTVSLESRLSLDRDWRLRTSAEVADLRPASQFEIDRCTVTPLGLDITDRIIAEARDFLEQHLADIDALAAGVDTRSRFSSWWVSLREPIELSDSLWLAMGPEAVRRGPLQGLGDSVTVQLALQSRPQIVFGDRPTMPPMPLPPLDSGVVDPGLDLRVEARAEYGPASRFLERALAGRRIEMGGRTIQVDSLEIYGIGAGRLAMRLGVSGDLSGRLYLTGRPVIDVTTGQVSVPDLELDVATRDAILATAASWFTTPILRDYLREGAVWPTAPAVDWLTMWLERGLNRQISNDLRVSGAVAGVEIVGATALQDALWVRLAASGSASMFVQN